MGLVTARSIMWGGVGGIMAALVFRQQDAPKYVPGLIATLVSQVFMIVVIGILSVHFYMRNKAVKSGTKGVIEGKEGFLYTL